MTKDMTTGAITPLLVKFTIPLVLGNLFQLTYNAADSIIVGKFVGEDALAAVGTSNPLMTLAILFINGLCLGAGILVSTAYGAGDTQRVERQVSTTAIAGTVFSLVFSALCVLLATPLLRLMQVPEEILPIAVQYLRIVFAGLIHLLLQLSRRHHAGAGRQQERPLLFDDKLGAEHRRRPLLCRGAGLGQRRLRPLHRPQRGALLCALRRLHPVQSPRPSAGATLARL